MSEIFVRDTPGGQGLNPLDHPTPAEAAPVPEPVDDEVADLEADDAPSA